MRKYIGGLQILMMSVALGIGGGLYAKAEDDFSSYSFDELIETKEKLENELMTRPEYLLSLPEGSYIAGTDLPVGKYSISLNQVDSDRDSVSYYVYETKDMYNYDVDRLFLGDMPIKEGGLEAGSSVTVDLYDGYCLVAYRNGLNVQCSGTLEEKPDDTYEIPDGTSIPTGFYTVGDEIPEGQYSVYYGGKASSRYRVYSTMEEAQNDFSDELSEIILSSTNTSGMVSLKNGQVVRVEYNDVIMKKSEGFVFD